MDHEFWRQRWRDGQLRFHQAETNAHLARFLRLLTDGLPRPRVFVPLCGKSRDMTFLAAEGCAVTGVELVEDALRAFFEEQEIPYTREEAMGGRAVFSGGAVRAFSGDFFTLTPEEVGPQDVAYDRAALIALPEGLRPAYAEHLLSFLPRGGRILLIGLYYDAPAGLGPPFAVSTEEARRLFGGRCDFHPLAEEDALESLPNLKAQGATLIRVWAALLTLR
jgi:thiopurine S-methyltransferase